MQIARVFAGVCAGLVCAGAAAPTPQATGKVTSLIWEKDEGERRVVRGWPGHPDPGETFILKKEHAHDVVYQ